MRRNRKRQSSWKRSCDADLEVTAENALLAANLHANLGGLYKQTSKLELAKQHMETGIHLLEQYGLAPYHDSIPQITNYAVLLTDMGEPYRVICITKAVSCHQRI